MKKKFSPQYILIVCCIAALALAACNGTASEVHDNTSDTVAEEDIVLERNYVNLAIGGTYRIVTDRECEYSSSDKNVVAVDNGVISGISAGEAAVTLRAGNKSAVIDVKVGGVMLAIGDSIFTTEFSPMMLDKIAADLGYTLIRDTISGSTIAPASSVGIVDHIKSGLYEELTDGRTPDVILIGRGTNDVYWSGVAGNPLKMGNVDSVDSSETYGAIRYTLGYFSEKFPDAHIFWSNSIRRSDASADRIKEFNANLEIICEEYGVEVIDLYNATGITAAALGKMTADGIHPNAIGRETYVIVIEKSLRTDIGGDMFSSALCWSKGFREGVEGAEYALTLETEDECMIYSTDENVAVYDAERGKLVFRGKGVAYIVAQNDFSVAVTTAVCL